MKKVFAFMAIVATLCVVACKKTDEPKKEDPKPTDATITANDVTVEEGKTVSIGATTNSSAAITYTPDDSGVYTVDNAGVVTGVKAGSGNILLKVAAVEGKFTAAEKTIKVTVTAAETPGPGPGPEPTASIEIDGDFADWAQLADGTYAKAINDPESPWEGVKEIRCFAKDDKVFYYIKFDPESLDDCKAYDTPAMHIRLCINTDGEYTTGYASYFLEAYDFIVEGAIMEDGAFVEFDGTLHQRIGGWVPLLEPGNGLVNGIGNGNEFEISLDRPTFNLYAATSDVPMPMGDEFQTGIRFYCNGWDEFSNMPNSSIDEEQGNGWGYLMRVKFN